MELSELFSFLLIIYYNSVKNQKMSQGFKILTNNGTIIKEISDGNFKN